ncbi:MAG: hypothetical protein R2690_18370 [Acidimicrobiales bacterium]
MYETADAKFVSVGSIEPQFCAQLVGRRARADGDLPHQMDKGQWPAEGRLAAIFKTKAATSGAPS